MAAAVLLALTELAASQADPRICRQLRAQLDGSAGGGQARRYDSAIVEQQRNIDRARARARAQGCTFTIFGGRSECGAIGASIDRMERNLVSLQSSRERMGGGGTDRRRILAALQANDCGAGDRTAGIASPRETGQDDGRTFLQRLFGVDAPAQTETILRPARPAQRGDSFSPFGGGDYRTVCVRTCDGYYFPMSFAASYREFARDQKNCEAACPGTAMQLYVTPGLDDDPAAMRSAAGGSEYGELATAFRYKGDGPATPNCGCNRTAGASVVAGFAPSAGKPQATQTPSPETPSATVSTSSIATLGSAPLPPGLAAEAVLPDVDRKVRVVGPAFLPDPEAAINLRAPAQPRAQ